MVGTGIGTVLFKISGRVMKKSGSESIFDSLLYPDSTSDFHFHFRIDPDPCKTNTDPKHCSLVGPANFLGSPRIRICIFFLYFFELTAVLLCVQSWRVWTV